MARRMLSQEQRSLTATAGRAPPTWHPRSGRGQMPVTIGGWGTMSERLNDDVAGRLEEVAKLLASVPGIGRELADRLYHDLGIETLEDLEAAARDGRLNQILGFGPKRLAGIRDSLAHRLQRVKLPAGVNHPAPSVDEILDVDREYRKKAAAGQLVKIAPRRFNASRVAWLPILHTTRERRHYTALFSNTALAHRLNRTDDWVVIYWDDGLGERQCTVVTAEHGSLAGRRVVRGREAEVNRGARSA